MSEDLNKLDLLIKIMGMTTSDNDPTALVALRKAQALLKAEGWDWERLLRSKIKVVENPFSKVTAPKARPANFTQPPPPQPAPPPQQTSPRQSRGTDPWGRPWHDVDWGTPKPDDQWGRKWGHLDYGKPPAAKWTTKPAQGSNNRNFKSGASLDDLEL